MALKGNALNFIISEAKRYAAMPYKETGTNHQKFSDIVNAYGLKGCQDQAWCATFQFALELMAFGKAAALRHWNMTASEYVGYSVFETEKKFAVKKLTGSTPKKGALVIFKQSHMGRVISLSAAKKTFQCVEGNSGDSVRIKTYSYTDSTIKSFCYIDYGNNILTTARLIQAYLAAYEMAHYLKWNYGDTHSWPPCIGDGFIACDREPALALWILGFTDQPRIVGSTAGMTVVTMEAYLTRKGALKITDPTKLKAGDMVMMQQVGYAPADPHTHAYVVVSYSNGRVTKYDMGAQWRIADKQPFRDIPVNEWGAAKRFYAAFRLPTSNEKETGRLEISTKVWAKGDSGSHVKLAQMLLRGRGYKGKDGRELQRDGKAGTNTIYALKRFQEKHSLDDTGICDKRTWNLLTGRKVTEA